MSGDAKKLDKGLLVLLNSYTNYKRLKHESSVALVKSHQSLTYKQIFDIKDRIKSLTRAMKKIATKFEKQYGNIERYIANDTTSNDGPAGEGTKRRTG